MSLSDISFPPYLDTSSKDIIADFFIPALSNSLKYDRGVGYFSSGWFRIAAKGMTQFATNGGFARWVTSPMLDEDDWNALATGDAAKEDDLLYEILKKNIEDLRKSLEIDTLSAIAWMIADNILDFKIALPRNKLDHGDFHDKFGIFADADGNHIVFNGSYNDSIQGTRNYESIKIFCSWDLAATAWVEGDKQRFENLWNNLDPNVRVYDLKSAAKEKILELRSNERPYQVLSLIYPIGKGRRQPEEPRLLKLRNYQEEAITAWESNNYRGILEMATGTGKTITSLAAATRIFRRKQRLILLIVVPYKHLVTQWSDECINFGFKPIKIVESSREWEPEFARQIQVYRMGLINNVCIVATNSALVSNKFSFILNEVWNETLIIIDEVHHAGSPVMQKKLPLEAPWRLGLSATPIRNYDELGTDTLLNYFGEIIFEFGLEKAIGKFLTPYYYYPIPVAMTEEEFGEYCILTRQLGKFVHSTEGEMPEIAKRIAIKRARIQNNSITKLEWLRNNISKYQNISYTLFYVGESLFDPVKQLLGVDKRIRIHEFTQRQNNLERQNIINLFSKGDLQALVAMKCLDEGIDVPPTREAYFLASSGNPREFIQRRGRVLRLFEGKEFAIIRDLISIPPIEFIEMGKMHPDYSAIRSSFVREYKRIKEFASLAINRYQALEPMFEIAQKLELLDI